MYFSNVNENVIINVNLCENRVGDDLYFYGVDDESAFSYLCQFALLTE